MEKNRIDKTTSQIAVVLQEVAVILLLSLVWATDSMFPLAAPYPLHSSHRNEPFGLVGGGKSYLACALGKQVCQLGFRTEYLNMNKFIERIALSKIDGTFLKVITYLEKND